MAKALTLFEARDRVLLACKGAAVAVETVPLAAAHGRVLARPIAADTRWPSTDRAAMDGFAVAAGSAGLPAGTALPVVGESLAGHPFAGPLAKGTAIRIMTGAVVPPGADAVVAVEHTSGFGGATVELRAAVKAGQHVRPAGSELQPGTEVLAAGARLRAAEIGVLAVLGITTVAVAKAPRVAIVATGDEVVPVEQSPLPHQVRESNSWALAAQVAECGGIAARLGIAPDEPAGLRALLARGLESADVLLTIGGVSAGSHDLVHGTLAGLGVQQDFHGLDLKPGKPTFFGVRGAGVRRQYVFGLPGNPASTFTVFDLLVRPLLLVLQGVAVGEWLAELPAAGAPWQPNARLQALPATVRGVAGGCVAELAPGSPSGDPFRLTAGNAYALVPGNARPGEPGT
ncbi:MAG: molybdopterin molybdotransferase MoeA, partial [Planctomycetota bacterium]